MADMDKDLNRITNYFKTRDEVSALYLFGSAARSRFTKDSDIDIAVLINERKMKRKDLRNDIRVVFFLEVSIIAPLWDRNLNPLEYKRKSAKVEGR